MNATFLPLETGQTARCDRVAMRLRIALEKLLDTLPREVRSYREIAAHLELDRNTCQRVTAAVAERGAPRGVLLRVPGVRGLESFAEAFPFAEQRVVGAVKTAVRAYADLIRDLGGSQSRLSSRIRASTTLQGNELPNDEATRARRRRYEADVQLMGLSVETRLVLDAFRPLKEDPDKFEHATVLCWKEARTLYAGMPFTTGVWVNAPDRGSEGEQETGLFAKSGEASLVEEFCSKPLPDVSLRGHQQDSGFTMNMELLPGGAPRDLCIGRLLSPAGIHPRLEPHPRELTRTVVPRYPSRQLIIETYLHHSFLQECVPTTGVYFHTRSGLSYRERWFDRMPNTPAIEVQGSGIRSDPPKGYTKMPELTAHFFEQLGWDPSEFRSHRMLVDYPLSSAEYVLSFEFDDSPDTAS